MQVDAVEASALTRLHTTAFVGERLSRFVMLLLISAIEVLIEDVAARAATAFTVCHRATSARTSVKCAASRRVQRA